MNIKEVIAKKRDKQVLTKEEINYFVKSYTEGKITDYHAAALVMAIYINGMTNEETANLAIAMAQSGEILDLSKIPGIIVDKHSTGGVGDKITLILMPIIASLGVPVAKMSGRGLGFTGGTADKLQSIPGYNIELTVEEFISNIQKIGICLMGQTKLLAPADKKLYALRDAICCTDSIPLIASSIMSKKIASGAQKIVLDVTCGSGAFMRTKEDAEKLAKLMKEIGNLAGKETVCIITNMDEPLGKFVGNNLEMIETVESLKGKISVDVKEVVQTLGAYILYLAGKGDNIEKNKEKIIEQIENGKALEKLKELVKMQGGDVSYIENTEKFPRAKYEEKIFAKNSGYIEKVDAREIGEASCICGAGRIAKEDEIESEVGIQIIKKTGEIVEKGELIAIMYANDKEKINEAKIKIENAYKIGDRKETVKTILEII